VLTILPWLVKATREEHRMCHSLKCLSVVAAVTVIFGLGFSNKIEAQISNGCPAVIYSGGCQPPSGGSCSTQVIKYLGGERGINLIYSEIMCCGEETTAPISYNGMCAIAFSGNRDTLLRLASLSKAGNLLIASCDGYVRHFHLSDEDAERLAFQRSPHADPIDKRAGQIKN
jgi:hypothetical protein